MNDAARDSRRDDSPAEKRPVATRERRLSLVLRCLGLLDLCALAVVFVPREWIEQAHAAAGLGTFPSEPIALYLARSASCMYALHGALVIYLSLDPVRFRGAIRLLSLVAIAHGALLVAIDLPLALPAWWKAIEGPAFALTGVVILALLRR